MRDEPRRGCRLHAAPNLMAGQADLFTMLTARTSHRTPAPSAWTCRGHLDSLRPLSRGAHLDLAVLYAGLEPGLRIRGRTITTRPSARAKQDPCHGDVVAERLASRDDPLPLAIYLSPGAEQSASDHPYGMGAFTAFCAVRRAADRVQEWPLPRRRPRARWSGHWGHR